MDSYDDLFVSLYYPREGWHSLIKEVIVPFAKKLEEDFGGNFFIIHLSYQRGENIGLSCRMPDGAIRNRARSLKKNAIDFFKQNPLGRNENKNYGQVFFKDFPMNSVQFNLHRFPFELTEKIVEKFSFPLFPVLETVSKNISGMLCEEVIDALSLITYSFYLHSISLKHLSDHLADTGEFIRYAALMARNAATKSAGEDLVIENYLAIYEENRAVLLQIIEEIFNDQHESDRETTWQTEWAQIFNYLNRIDKKTDLSIIYNEYKCLMHVIISQLGLDRKIFVSFLEFVNTLEMTRFKKSNLFD
jgi:hypothetical protein